MSTWSVNIFESFMNSLDFIDHNRLAVFMAPQSIERALREALMNRDYLVVLIKDSPQKSLEFFKPNYYVLSRPSEDPQIYSAWVSYLKERIPPEATLEGNVLSSLIIEEVEELLVISRIQAKELSVAYKTLQFFKSLKSSAGRAEVLIVVDGELTLINRFNLVTFLAKVLLEKLVSRVSLLRVDRLYKYFSSQEVEELLEWALRLYSESLGKEILSTNTREMRHLYFISLLGLEEASLLIRNLAGASQLAKFLTWGTTFAGSMGYAYLEGNAELLNQVNINEMVKICGWTVYKIFTPKTTTKDYLRVLFVESSDDLIIRLSRDVWEVPSSLREEERDLRTLIPLMKLTKEFLTTIERGS